MSQLKSLFSTNKPLLLFLGKFLLSYFTILLIYQGFLSISNQQNKVDIITTQVSKQSFYIIQSIIPDAEILLEKNYIIRLKNTCSIIIIEGCNSMSIIILFTSFIIGFSKSVYQTIRFILLGSLIIYGINIFRIVIIALGMYHFPQHKNILHEVVFPLIIYGTVLLLWLIWIKNYTYVRKTSEQ